VVKLRAVVAVLALAPLSCMGALEARLRVETARSSHLATQCASLTHGTATGDAGVFGGGLLDFRGELGAQLEGLVGGVGALDDELARFGGGATLDTTTRIVRELALLPGAIDAQTTLAVTSLTGAITELTRDFDRARAAAAELGSCVGGVSVTSSLEHTAQHDAAQITVQAVVACKGSVDILADVLGGLDDLERDFEDRYTAMRGLVEAMDERGDVEAAAKLRAPLEEVTAVLRAQVQWLDESRAIVGALSAFDLQDPIASASKLGQRLLARQTGGVAQAMFRVVRIGLRPIDRQLAHLSESGYGVGAVSVVFASGYIDRAVERVGVYTGKLARRLGGGANAMLYEACTALADPHADDGLAVLGMTSFYAGFIDGYGPAEQDSGDGVAAAWWRGALLAAEGDDAPLVIPMTNAALTAVQSDLLADWTALYAIHRAHAWGPPPAPVDRRPARLAYVETLLTSPELLAGSSTTYLDHRLVNVFVGGSSSSPSGGGGGDGGGTGDPATMTHKVDVAALSEAVGKLESAHKDLLDELTVREGHWRATQFTAAVCQSFESSKAASDAGVTCHERDASDAVSTLSLATAEFPEGAWEPTKKTAAPFEAIRRSAGLLAKQIRAQIKQLLGDQPSSVRVVVTGLASSDAMPCTKIVAQLAASAVPVCALAGGTPGVDLCRTDDGALHSGEALLSCGVDDVDANQMLAVLRGWWVRQAMVAALKKADRDTLGPRIQFELDPPPAQGSCANKKKSKTCTQYRVANVQVRAQ